MSNLPPELRDIPALCAHFNIPVKALIDNCFAVSHSIVREFPTLQARVIKGTWIGPIAPDTPFYWAKDLIGGVAHWWVALPDSTVLDATRWVFEGVEPYIYHGPNVGNLYR